MTETPEHGNRPAWVRWMHVAGVAYPVAVLVFAAAIVLGGQMAFEIALVGLLVLTVGTLALVGGIGRYLATK